MTSHLTQSMIDPRARLKSLPLVCFFEPRDAHLLKLIFLQFVFAIFLRRSILSLDCFASLDSQIKKKKSEKQLKNFFSFLLISFFIHFSCAHFLARWHLIYYGTIFIKAMGF